MVALFFAAGSGIFLLSGKLPYSLKLSRCCLLFPLFWFLRKSWKFFLFYGWPLRIVNNLPTVFPKRRHAVTRHYRGRRFGNCVFRTEWRTFLTVGWKWNWQFKRSEKYKTTFLLRTDLWMMLCLPGVQVSCVLPLLLGLMIEGVLYPG